MEEIKKKFDEIKKNYLKTFLKKLTELKKNLIKF